MGAWIETFFGRHWNSTIKSLPTWERGLKQILLLRVSIRLMSLPTWERGLKREVSEDIVTFAPSLPTWERGLKQNTYEVMMC